MLQLIFLLTLGLSFRLLAFGCESHFFNLAPTIAHLQTQHRHLWHTIKSDGIFTEASSEHVQKIGEQLIPWKKRIASGVDVNPHAVHATWENTVAPLPYDIRRVFASRPFVAENQALATVRNHGYRGFSQLHTIVSHGGLWTRGGGDLVKGLVPLNLAELVSSKNLEELRMLSAILSTSKQVGIDDPYVVDASTRAKEIVYCALQHPSAKPSIFLTLLQAAVLSKVSGYYIHVDFWTSRGTHRPIRDFINDLSKRIDSLEINSASTLANQFFIDSMKQYFAASSALEESHLFGLQIELRNFIAHDSEPALVPFETDLRSPGSSEGAGMWPFYLEVSNRAEMLRRRGIEYHMFRNAEVVGPVHDELAVMVQTGASMAYTVVPALATDKGGNPYRDLSRPGYFPMYEQSNVPPALQTGGTLYNANTVILKSWTRNQPWIPKQIAFEPAAFGSFRAKVNAGDPSLDMPSVLIRGERPRHYAPFKAQADVLDHGQDAVSAVMVDLERQMIEYQKHQASQPMSRNDHP